MAYNSKWFQYKLMGESQTEGLLTLWGRENYGSLLEACAMAISASIRVILGKLTGGTKTFPFTKMMTAICEIETGSAAVGYKALDAFSADYGVGYTNDVQSVIEYLGARKATFCLRAWPERTCLTK